jgi:hypothetical protein
VDTLAVFKIKPTVYNQLALMSRRRRRRGHMMRRRRVV